MTKDEWLNLRREGIGASDAASVLGISPWKTNLKLWEEKIGISESEDISDKDCVKYGVAAEPLIRQLFQLDHPGWKVGYEDYDIIRNTEHSFILCTLDGRLEDEYGRKGILEIKTTEIRRASQKDKWRDQLPDYYYSQVLHQFLATGYDFAVLKARIKYQGKIPFIEEKEYHIDRSEVRDDLEYLLKKEIAFWEHVKNKTKPALILPNL